ncbi:MAG: nitroreductase family protein [Bacteroidales bacterium]|nr:nitroreductase family protein [Bacteroidales bacterium]
MDATQAVLDNIAARTSVRAYTSEPVPEEMVETLLRAAMAAPSAMNRQPWEFVVVNDRAVLDTLAGKLRYAKMLVQAPLAIVVCAETMITHRDGSQSENGLWEHDASAATQNILLAAKALGLGAVWTAASDSERASVVKEALNIPGTIMPLCVIPIGFPAEDPEPKDKWKPEKIHYNKW